MNRFSAVLRHHRNIFKKSISYGVISSSPELDTLGISVSLANYFRSAKGFNTAIAVPGRDDSISHMLSDACCVSITPPGYDDGILTWYILDNLSDAFSLTSGEYDRIVVALRGSYHDYDPTDLLRFSHIIAVASSFSWRYRGTEEFLRSTIVQNEGMRQRFGNTVYMLEGTKSGNSDIRREFAIKVSDISAIRSISDPYRLTKSDLSLISTII